MLSYKKYINKINRVHIFLAFLLFGSALTYVSIFKTSTVNAYPPEIKEIVARKWTSEQKPYLLKLLNRVGPVKAQEYLYQSELPFTSENHLLVHTIGEYVYEKYGSSGLKLCKEYFQAACYHGFIINDLSDNGTDGIAKSIDDCDNAGSSVLWLCSHAAGHGFLVWKDYDLLAALSMCDELFAGDYKQYLASNCHVGIFMENVVSVHEGTLSSKRWVKADDIYYPCNDPRISDRYLKSCWIMQAGRMYQMFPDQWEKIANGCDNVENPIYQKHCYDSFALQIHPYTQGEAGKAFNLCSKATGERWKNNCLTVIVRSAFESGDRKKLPYEICHRIHENEKESCYKNLFGSIWMHIPQQGIKEACSYIKDPQYIKKCLEYKS